MAKSKSPEFPEEKDYSKLRNSKPGQRVPSIQKDVLGYGNYDDPAQNDLTILGHPEAGGMYSMNYDNDSENLDAAPTRHDSNYASAEEIRRRSKGSPF
jgi:hypothetical protein